MPQVLSTRPTHGSPQTSRQARDQYRRHGPRISSQEKRRLARGGELLARAERIKAAEQRRKQGENKRKEKEIQQREERRKGCREWVRELRTGGVNLAVKKGDEDVKEESSGLGPWRGQSSQMSLGRFLKVMQAEAKPEDQQQTEVDREPWSEEVDAEGLVEAALAADECGKDSITTPVTAKPDATVPNAQMSPPSLLPAVIAETSEACSENPGLPSSDSFWEPFMLSSTAIERELLPSSTDDVQQRTVSDGDSSLNARKEPPSTGMVNGSTAKDQHLPSSSSQLTGLLSTQDIALLADELETKVDGQHGSWPSSQKLEEAQSQYKHETTSQTMAPPAAKRPLSPETLVKEPLVSRGTFVQEDDFILSTQDWREMG